MTIRTDVDVLKAKSEMSEIIADDTLIRIDPQLRGDLGLSLGDQVRIKRSSTEYALYTLSADYEDGTDNDDVRMGLSGRRRLGTDDSMTDVEVNTEIPHPTYTDAEALSNSEFVERLDDGSNDDLVICAPHGGMIENWTDEMAERMASQLSAKSPTCWRCKGWKSGGGAYERWHITSTDISKHSFPLLDSISGRDFGHAVSFHGWSEDDVVIGGTETGQVMCDVRNAIATALSGSGIDVVINRSVGDHQDNFVNWLTQNGGGGLQIELPSEARTNHWQAIADAVAAVYDDLI